MTKVKYSIIVPHKNSFESLKVLLMTIPDSSEFEVIIVDDNSEYSEVNKLENHHFSPNVNLIFNKESGGAGKARNIALKKAIGKWVLFADSDDYFSESMALILEHYYNSDADIIYFGTTSNYINTEKLAYRHERYMNLVNDFINDKSKEDALRYFYTPPWAKMIRRDIIIKNDIQFEEILTSNDIHFSLKSAFYAKSILANSDILYHITVSHGSLINSLSLNHFDARFNAALRANNFLRSINKRKYQQSVLYFLAKSYMFGVRYMFIVCLKLLKNRSNLFIGMGKIFSLRKVLKQRENKDYLEIK